jgi:heme-degrading monooxygenase HmoA
MIRVMYRWTVKKEDREEFIRTWQEGTLKIQTHCAGAMGSILLRSSVNPEYFFGLARWTSKETWEAAQRSMPLLDLQGPKPESEYFLDELIDIIPEPIEPESI